MQICCHVNTEFFKQTTLNMYQSLLCIMRDLASRKHLFKMHGRGVRYIRLLVR